MEPADIEELIGVQIEEVIPDAWGGIAEIELRMYDGSKRVWRLTSEKYTCGDTCMSVERVY